MFGCLVAGFVGAQVYNLFPHHPNLQMEEFMVLMREADILTFAVMLFITGFLIPWIEELVFRGLLWKVSSFITENSTFLIVVTSVIFCLAHGTLAHMAGVLPVALFLGWVRHKYNSIWVCAVGHSFMNTASILLERYAY
jgi:hypothetical protein